MILASNVFVGVKVRNELVALTFLPERETAVAVTVYCCETFSGHLLCHTVPAALSVPVTGSPFVRTVTLLIVPPPADTVIPRFGAASTLPLVGTIDTLTPPD